MDELREKKRSDYWEDNGMVFVTGGLRWGVAPNGATVCMGPADLPAAQSPSAGNRQEPVTKLPDKGNLPTNDIPSVDETIMLHEEKRGPGRPRKALGEPVCRMTTWRREKEKQLELVF